VVLAGFDSDDLDADVVEGVLDAPSEEEEEEPFELLSPEPPSEPDDVDGVAAAVVEEVLLRLSFL